MRKILFILLFIALPAPFINGAVAENIAQGIKVVVIDAGHGGKFPGAYYAGIYEKHLTLSVALRLGKLIEEQMPWVTVVYTRKTDTALAETLADDLQRRADIANKSGGELFVSIHVNAARSTTARGVETLIMGESSKEQRYNESALFNNNREDLIDMSDEKTAAIVRAYIQNLQFTYGEYSMAMARSIQQQYIKKGRHDRGIKPQLLRVLYATDMPGVLTEIGFMSNAEEMAYMKSERGQQEIALSLFAAVKNYDIYVKGARQTDESVPTESRTTPQPDTKSVREAKLTTVDSPVKGAEPVAVAANKVSVTEPVTSAQRGYVVQVLASSDKVSLLSSLFKSYKGQVKQYVASGKYCYKYCVGFCAERTQAQSVLNEVRRVFPNAFIVQCEGERIVNK